MRKYTYTPYPDGLDTYCQHCGCVPVLHLAGGQCPFPEAALRHRNAAAPAVRNPRSGQATLPPQEDTP